MKFKWFCLLAALMGLLRHDGKSQTTPTPQVPAGLIYQAAIQAGLQPISPVSGQAIINEKAAINWKNIAVKGLTNAALFTALGGVGGIVSIGTKAIEGLMVAHAVSDAEIVPLLEAAAPNPNDIPPVIRVADTVAPSADSCSESSMFVTPTKIKQGGIVMVAGLQVSFTIQSPSVLRNAAGGKINKFQVVDVIACIPSTPPIIVTPQLRSQSRLAIPQMTGPYPQCWMAPEDGNRYCRNMSGVIFRPDLPNGTPNVVTQPQTFIVDPEGNLDHLTTARKLYFAGEYSRSVKEYNAAIREHPEDRGIFSEMTGALYNDGPFGIALADYIRSREVN